jgi:hypothetical protein
MSDLSPSQIACNRAIEKLAYAITNLNLLAKYQSADSLETILHNVQDGMAVATAEIAKIEGLAAEAKAKRLKAFGRCAGSTSATR